MMTRRALMGAAMALPVRAWAYSPQHNSIEAIADRIRDAVDRHRAVGGIPGGVVIVQQDGRQAVRAMGQAWFNGPAMSKNTLFRQYCMTKPLTAVLISQLLHNRRLAIEDKLVKWFPEFSKTPVINMGSTPRAQVINVGMLLNHTAGFTMPVMRHGPLQSEYLKLGLIDARIAVPQVNAVIQSRPSSTEDFCRRLASLPLAFEPGSKYEYGMSYEVLGAIIERVCDMPLQDAFQDMVLSPLGMTDTSFSLRSGDIHRLAGEYYIERSSSLIDGGSSSIYETPIAYPDAGSGLLSTPSDYARFVRFVSGFPVRNSLAPRIVPMIRRDALPSSMQSLNIKGVDVGYGMGGYVFRSPEPGGRPKGTYGWSGIGGTYFWSDPINRIDVITMAQFGPAHRLLLGRDIVQAAYQPPVPL